MYMVKVAQAKYTTLMEKVTAALDVHNTQRVAARVRRKQAPCNAASKQHVVTQPEIDIQSGKDALPAEALLSSIPTPGSSCQSECNAAILQAVLLISVCENIMEV